MTRKVLTPEIRQHIVDLALAEICVHNIWLQIGKEVQKGYINVILSQARKDGIAIPYRKSGPHPRGGRPPKIVQNIFTLKLTGRAAEKLDAAAKRRSITIRELCWSILETVSHDGIIDAVLDDNPCGLVPVA